MALDIRDCLSLCLLEKTLKAIGPFYLVPMPGEVKYPTSIGVRANMHLGGQTEFCPNGGNNLFVTRPRQGEKIIMNYCSACF